MEKQKRGGNGAPLSVSRPLGSGSLCDSSSPIGRAEWTGRPLCLRPLLDLSGASIQGSNDDRNPAIVLPNQRNDVSHFAVDIGGSLIKLVYFSKHPQGSNSLTGMDSPRGKHLARQLSAGGSSQLNMLRASMVGGRLHFVKFETSKLNECLEFIESMKLHCFNYLGLDGQEDTIWGYGAGKCTTIKATGGGAYKYAEMFKERLGITLEKEDEMICLVSGANFLLRTIRDEAFTHLQGRRQFVEIDTKDLFPYMLVNIGSGVSMIKVDGDGKYERISGTSVGGGTFWGLGRLLLKMKNFDDILELSQKGNNAAVDMLVGDIYGDLGYSKVGLAATTIASSFGKVVSENKELPDYNPEDIALSLLRMISYNIGQIAYLNALRYNLKRIFFSGFFTRGHAYTMDTMSFAVSFWSRGEMQAMFLRHEGFLGALGAFMSHDDRTSLSLLTPSQCIERFPVGAPFAGGEVHGPPIRDVNEKVSWVEKFVKIGSDITGPTPTGTITADGEACASADGLVERKAVDDTGSSMAVGVLHLCPLLEPFPLLANAQTYEPNTVDLAEAEEREYWLDILEGHLPGLVEKAVACEGGTDDAKRRGDAFARAFRAHLARLREDPAAYGKMGLANLLEMREECLREFQFRDAYRAVKQRENEASLAVLPDLLAELDFLDPEKRLLAIVEGVLAGNIFDWGSKACVELYTSGTIMEIYRMSRSKLQRPWRVDDFDAFKERFFCRHGTRQAENGALRPSYQRALLFADNSGADIVLGMIPFARELLRNGTEVVLVANALPAINDITISELHGVISAAAEHCKVIQSAADIGVFSSSSTSPERSSSPGIKASQPSDGESATSGPGLWIVSSGYGSPCIDFRQVSAELAVACEGADLIVLEGMGRAVHTNYHAKFTCDALKLAMIKNERLAKQLVGGSIYDCICKFEPAA